jgi:hypothetical protein
MAAGRYTGGGRAVFASSRCVAVLWEINGVVWGEIFMLTFPNSKCLS